MAPVLWSTLRRGLIRALPVVLVLQACDSDSPAHPDTKQKAPDQGIGESRPTPEGGAVVDFLSYPDVVAPDFGCVGIGCACQDDTPCSKGGIQAICLAGTCTAGCDVNVPCQAAGEKCCDSKCVAGACCGTSDCSDGKICDPQTHSCTFCTADSECGVGNLCCGATGQKTCVTGTCCASTECQGGFACAEYVCRQVCNPTAPCASGDKCCGIACYSGDCCSNADCQTGQACVSHKCGTCTLDKQCGAGEICSSGKCTAGCNGNVPCGASSVCCGTGGLCGPGSTGCSGGCFSGNCCTSANCSSSKICAEDHNCRTPCSTASQCGAGEHCCSGYCYSQPCVSTLAGNGIRGTGGSVAFGSAFVEGVYSMAPDGKGNVFFTELYTGQIRVVNNSPQNIGAVPPGTVGRIAGGTYGCKPGPALQAEMATPIGLARDPQGNLYAADWDCAVIWKISADYSTVTLLAGQPGNHTLADGTGSAAAFHYPRGLAYGVDGNLYVSEWYASVIRQVSLAGAVKTIAGVPNQLGEVDGPGAQAQFYHPGGLTMDQGGVLFVADWEPGSVRKITGIQTGNIAVTSILPAKPGDGGSWVRKYGYAGYTTLSVAAGANLYVNFWDAGVYRLAPAAAPAQEYVATLIVPTSGAITNALDPNGKDLWLGGWATGGNDQYLNTVRKYDLTAGQVTLTVGQSPRMGGGTDGTGQDATFSPGGSGGLAVDSTGTIWVADFAGQRVRKVTPDGKVTSIGSGEIGEASGSLTTAKFCYPGAITTVGTDAYVVDAYCSRRIMKIDSVTGTVTPLNSICVPNEPGCVIPTPPGGLVADQASPPNLYLTAYLEDNAGKGYGSGYDGMPMLVKVPNLGTGTPAFFAGTPNKYGCQDGPINVGRFGQWPYGLAVDAGGYLYVGDSQCGVRRVAPDGTISTLESTFGAVGVGVGPLVAGKQALYASRAGEAIWTVDRLTGAVAWLSGGGTSYTDHFKDGKLSEAKFWGPYGIATDSLGAIYVWDVYNTRVRVIYP